MVSNLVFTMNKAVVAFTFGMHNVPHLPERAGNSVPAHLTVIYILALAYTNIWSIERKPAFYVCEETFKTFRAPL